MPRESILVWLMPWSEFREPIQCGNIEVWDFYKEGPGKITDTQEMLWLAQFISCFRDRNGKELRNVGIIQIGDVPFEGYGRDGNYLIRWAGNAIFFAHMVGTLRSFLTGRANADAIGNSERFQLMSVLIDEDGMLHYANSGALGATEIAGKHVMFHEPPQNGLKLDVPDRLILQGLGKLNESKPGCELWRQLKRCFEWTYTAWTLSEEISPPARFVSLMTAFEALARLDIYDKAPTMARYAATLCKWDILPQIEELPGKGKTPEPATKPEKFIVQFAQYRNSFVHGDTLPWGLIKHVVGSESFDTKHVMSMIIYSMVANILIENDVFEDSEKAKVENDLKKIVEAFRWDTQEKIEESPHIGRVTNPLA